ncbi:probable serine hydrolase isoform X2 [Penaeus japonicus]|nr:probable serine hydrolase isoform X2 [Penaeus japonicus]XP_042890077.1 probable serine hydrolase isoform X2 [Penaeus japonicus]
MLRRILNGFLSGPVLTVPALSHQYQKMSSQALPKEISIPVPYGHIAGKIWNEGGYPILGLHGWMDNAGTWDGIGPLLPSDVSLISIDFPGHGHSSHSPAGVPSHFMNLVVVIERVLRHFGWEEVSLLGHSMGGGAAMMYAATFPEKVKKLMVMDFIKPMSVMPCNQPEKTALAVEQLLKIEKILGSTAPMYDYNTIVERMLKSYGNSLTEKSAKILLKRGSKQLSDGLHSFTYDPKLKGSSIISLTFEQQKAFAERLKCDMLLIKATSGPLYESQELYDEIIEIYGKSTRSFQYITVEGTHHVHLNQPEKVVPLIKDFIQNTGN